MRLRDDGCSHPRWWALKDPAGRRRWSALYQLRPPALPIHHVEDPIPLKHTAPRLRALNLAPTDATHGLVPGLLFRLATHGSLHRRSCCDTQTKQPRLESQTPGWCTVVRLSSNWQTRWESIRVCRLPRKSFANGVHPRPPSRDRRRLSSREADQLERRLQPRLDALGRLPAPNSCSPDAVRAWVSTPSAASGPARDSMQGDQRRIRERLRCRF